MGAFPTREAIGVTRVNDVLFSEQVFLNPGEQVDVRFESDLTTTDRYDSPLDAVPPPGDPIELFDSSMGHLLDVFFITNIAAGELKYYEAMDGGGEGWRLVDQWMISPGVVFKLVGYRVHTSYGKISLCNGGSGMLIGDFQVRMSSL